MVKSESELSWINCMMERTAAFLLEAGRRRDSGDWQARFKRINSSRRISRRRSPSAKPDSRQDVSSRDRASKSSAWQSLGRRST